MKSILQKILAWLKALPYKAGKLFVNANYLAQMAHFAWAAMFCLHFVFWTYFFHVLNPHLAVIIATSAWMTIWATPKEWIFDPIFENAGFWDNALDWSSYLAGCLSVLIPVLIWA